VQQGSPNETSSALKIAFFSGFQVLCSECAGVLWFEHARIWHRDCDA